MTWKPSGVEVCTQNTGMREWSLYGLPRTEIL